VNVIVDTSIWSLALRRKPTDLSPRETRIRVVLSDLIREGRAQLLGVIRQELLSGLREHDEFQRLRTYLRSFPDPALALEDYENAAHASNQCRTAGITGSPIGMLVCAVALRQNWQIFSLDRDFAHYSSVLPIRLVDVT
jgi:predicted nucleic acid-binding protein